MFTRDGSLNNSPYCVTLEAEDLYIETISKKSAKVNICIEATNELPDVMALKSQLKLSSSSESESTSDEENKIQKTTLSVSYPKEVNLLKSAKYLARVVQPENMKELYLKNSANFSIVSDKSGAFAITRLGGILYVKNETALEEASETLYNLTIFAVGKTSRAYFIGIHLLDASNISCSLNTISDSCSFSDSKRLCSKSCAIGTNGKNCQWRGLNSPTSSTNYATCVPEIDYCPDNICDPLELLDEKHCPQDCTFSVIGSHIANKNNRGIFKAPGSCHCYLSGTCNCAYFPESTGGRGKKKQPNKDNDISKNEPLKAENHEEEKPICGASCIAIATLCLLGTTFIIIGIAMATSKVWKRISKKAQLIQDKSDQKDDKTIVELPLVALPIGNEFKFDADSKWTFKKEWLEFDKVLGEGEFGKVLKAFDIQTEKRKPVAVKMLKTGANSSELIALLSEFQLLQDVSHPNVIKLIGASTEGDCPFLVLEYAMYGSLRSYLRLSRKLDTCEVDNEVGIEPVTVKDILSFAWQICKGMNYLTEIKVSLFSEILIVRIPN